MTEMKVERVKYVIWAAYMTRAVQFYRDVLGGEVVKESEVLSEVIVSGATGAGSAGTPTGTEADGGGRGSAAHATDPHTTNLKAVKPSASDSQASDPHTTNLKAVKPYDPGRPSEIEVEFHSPARLVEYRNRKGTEQIDEHTLVSRADDWWTAWSQFYF